MPTKKNTSGTADPGNHGDLGQAEVQAKFDAEQEQGYRGVRADPTPVENYTLQGVTSGAPTPESAPPDHPLSSRRDPNGVYARLGKNEVLIDTDEPGADRAEVQKDFAEQGEQAAKEDK